MFKRIKHDCRFADRDARAGATLIELLAVLVIMALLVASAIPVIAPAMSNRQVREASRQVSGFFTGARNRALQTGRPFGVILDRMPGLPEACVTLSYAEVPPPYAGDSLGSTVTVSSSQLVQFNGGDTGWLNTVRVGDLIRFNYQGSYYQFVKNPSPPNSNPQAYDVASGYYNQAPTAADWPWQLVGFPDVTVLPPSGTNLTFQIYRAPVKVPAGSITLPAQAAIDLTCSGFDFDDLMIESGNHISPWVSAYSFQPIWPRAGVSGASPSSNPFSSGVNDTSSVLIMFAPSGALDSIWCWANSAATVTPASDPVITQYKPVAPVHLMIGRRDMLPLPTSVPANINPQTSGFTPYLNWQDLNNFWVSINPTTGLVATTENTSTVSGNYQNSGYGNLNELTGARTLALEAHRMGGSR